MIQTVLILCVVLIVTSLNGQCSLVNNEDGSEFVLKGNSSFVRMTLQNKNKSGYLTLDNLGNEERQSKQKSFMKFS